MACERVREFLSQQDVEFEVRGLEDEKVMREFASRHGGIRSAPAVEIDDGVVTGFDLPGLVRALDAAGLSHEAATKPAESDSSGRAVSGEPVEAALLVADFHDDSVTALAWDRDSGRFQSQGSLLVPGKPAVVAAGLAGGSAVAVGTHAAEAVSFLGRKGKVIRPRADQPTYALGAIPKAMVPHPDSSLIYVSHRDGVSLFDAQAADFARGSFDASTTPVPGSPYHLALDPSGDRLYVSSAMEPGVFVLDTATMRPATRGVREFTLPFAAGYGCAISHDGSILFRLGMPDAEERLFLHDARSGELLVESRETGPMPMAVTAHPDLPVVYVSCLGNRTVEFRNGETGEYLFGEAGQSSFPVGAGVRSLTVDPRDNSLYATCFDDDVVVVLDALTGARRASARTGRGPISATLVT